MLLESLYIQCYTIIFVGQIPETTDTDNQVNIITFIWHENQNDNFNEYVGILIKMIYLWPKQIYKKQNQVTCVSLQN